MKEIYSIDSSQMAIGLDVFSYLSLYDKSFYSFYIYCYDCVGMKNLLTCRYEELLEFLAANTCPQYYVYGVTCDDTSIPPCTLIECDSFGVKLHNVDSSCAPRPSK